MSKKAGRPTVMSGTIKALVIDGIANGESMRSIATDLGIDRQTILNALAADADFAAKCARAREMQAELLFEGMADIETRCLAGEIEAATARTVLSSQQWRAAKLAPKKYGEKQQLEHSGPDGGAVQINLVERVIVKAAHPDG